MPAPKHRVTVYSGCSYSDVPLEFFLGEERHRVSRIVSSKLEERLGMEGTRKVWLVEDDSGGLYTLTYQESGDLWRISPAGGRRQLRRPRPPAPSPPGPDNR